jgi:Tol biopolymer transport system component
MNVARIFWCSLLACPVFTCASFWLHEGRAPSHPNFSITNQITHDGLAKSAVLSDGAALYVTELKDGHQVISMIVPGTLQQSTIPTPFADVRAMDVSPDHKSLLVSPLHAGLRSRELWTVPLNLMASTRLGGMAADDAAWSPDGEQLVSVKGHEIWINSSRRRNSRKLALLKGRPFSPRFSPDGQRIRFSVSDVETNTSDLWELGSDGSNLHELLPGWNKPHSICCGVWSKNGESYIFQATQSSSATFTTLWALANQGGEPTQLTDGPMSFGSPWPGPENTQIWALGVKPTAEVVKYDPASQTFTTVLSGISATDLDFSPDSTWVSYVSIPDGTLWRSRADGSERLQLTFAPERAALPKWAPNGKEIAYVSIRTGQPSQIMRIRMQGDQPSPVFAENRGQIDANWSADGQKMVFGSVAGATSLSISLLDLRTHKLTTIPGSDGLFSPRLSPDGRYIAALSPDFTKVMLFDFRTRQWSTWLTEPAGAVSYPMWSADSKSICFDDLVTDEESIRRVNLGDDHTERVFALHGIDRYPGPFGLWSGRTPDGLWMFVRDRSTQEVYSLNLGSSK